MNGCKDCEELITLDDIIGIPPDIKYQLKEIAIKWFKHLDEHPNLIQSGSCRTLSDFFGITEKDLKCVKE